MSTIDEKAKEVMDDGAAHAGDGKDTGAGGYIILFFIIGFAASMVLGWVAGILAAAVSFPDVMRAAGVELRTVGATNHCLVGDYESGINENTGLLLMVHTSNYQVVGFTKYASHEELIALGRKHGYKNAQVTVLAPTGTIAFMMDCDTTGIEPDIALVKYKLLAGGGMLTLAGWGLARWLRTKKPPAVVRVDG